MKLSKRSDEFVKNVRLYLMTSGKNEDEIEEVVEELVDHLVELERRGKSVDSITDGSPAAYMESLEKEMTSDYGSWLKYIPIFSLLVIAYTVIGSALKGTFELNSIQLIGVPLIILLAVFVYWLLFRQMAKKEWGNTKSFFGAFMAVITVNLLFVAIILASSYLVEPFYVASPAVNKVIVGICILAFIVGAIVLKQWFVAILPVFLYGPDVVFNYTALSETAKLIGSSILSMVLILAMLVVYMFIYKKRATGA
ncbi:DUF1129 domain-containing protein [Filibacter tadaridae]|uniref:HAAS transmembrane region domain-containing protein n=1 Tax=Filibacter tadaridae TaxID=2483811 RepID=A0A3P5WQL2_9BACL|nr:DUF1129 family protein [Filibacter tadaridae]VDC18202.1 hypothetical protein FILTAD_00123 [Filibacter tadaridae]